MFAAPLVLVLAAAAQTVPPKPDRWVTDLSGQLSAPAEQALDAKLESFDHQTGHQVLLWIGPLGNDDPAAFATRAFDAWKPGRAGVDDGVVLFVFPDARRSRIEVGYGLEGVVTDATSGQILRDVVAPRLQADDWDAATAAGIDALLVRIDPDAAAKAGASAPVAAPAPVDEAPPVVVIAVILILLLLIRTRWGPALLWSFPRSGSSWGGRSSGGSRGGGGGGFRGGGGRSGGGGASGSW